MIKINNRLKTIATFVNIDSSGILDVGCDHALLDIYLLQKYPSLKVIASDINKGPLQKAKENVEKYHMLDKIDLKLADGLDSIENNIDIVIISGMGTETIVDILNKNKDKLKNVNKLILSSNNKFKELREKVILLGYKINKEQIVYEDDKFYIIIDFIKGTNNYSFKEFYFGPYLLTHKNSIFYKYYNNLKEKKLKVLNDLPSNLIDKRKKLEKEIKMLTEELNS